MRLTTDERSIGWGPFRLSSPFVCGVVAVGLILASPLPDGRLRAMESAPQVDAERITLANGLSLADWVLLAHDRLESGETDEILAESSEHLRAFGAVPELVELSDRAASTLLEALPIGTEVEARIALDRLTRFDLVPALQLHLANAHQVLGDFLEARDTYRRWLRLVPQTHPARLDVLRAYMEIQGRLVEQESARFSEVVGRPFTPDTTDSATGWTDLHYAALLDLPIVAEHLVESGLGPDIPLLGTPSLSPPLGDQLNLILSKADQAVDESLRGWNPNGGETPLALGARRNAVGVVRLLLERDANPDLRDKAGSAALHLAAAGGAVEAVGLLLNVGVDPNTVDHAGTTALFAAVGTGDLNLIELLLDHGADANLGNEAGLKPLHAAVHTRDPELVQLLLERGAAPTAVDKDGATPLHLAAESAALPVVEVLLDHGMNVGAMSSGSRTALHSAAAGGNSQVVELLLSRGLDLAARSDAGWTALHFAARNGHAEVIRLFLERGLTPLARTEQAEGVLHFAAGSGDADAVGLLLAAGLDVRARDDDGWTPLHWAALDGSPDVTETLLVHGADLNAKSKGDKRTALHIAATGGHIRVMRLLLDRGARLKEKDREGWLPLHLAGRSNVDAVQLLLNWGSPQTRNDMSRMLSQAAIGNAPDVAKFALERGADVNWQTGANWPWPGDEKTALHWTAIHDSLEVAALLLDHGADTSSRDWSDAGLPEAIHWAAGSDSWRVAELLIDRGVDPEEEDFSKLTPLHWAASGDSEAVARLLLDRGVAVDVRGGRGRDSGSTPLHVAAATNATQVTQLLLERGANPGIADDDGVTALGKADEEGNAKVAEILRRRGAQETSLGASDSGSGFNWGKAAVIAGVAGLGVAAADAGVPVETVAETTAAAIADIVEETGGENLDRIARGQGIQGAGGWGRILETDSETIASRPTGLTTGGKCEIPGYAEGNPDAFDPTTTRLSWCPYLDGTERYGVSRVDSVGGNALNAELGRCAIELGHVAPDRLGSIAATVRQSCDIVEALATRDDLDCRCPRSYYALGNE